MVGGSLSIASNTISMLPLLFPARGAGTFYKQNKKIIKFFIILSSKIYIFDTFFTFTPAVLSNAAPDLPDTMYGAQGLDAHHSRLGRATVRRTAQKVSNFLRIFVPFWSPFILTIVSGARQERTPDSSPSRRAGPNTAPGLPAAGGRGGLVLPNFPGAGPNTTPGGRRLGTRTYFT